MDHPAASDSTPSAPVAHTPSYSGAALSWLQALPGGPDLVDPFHLDDEDFAVRSVGALCSGRRFDLPLQNRQEAGRVLQHFYFESRNREKVFGTKNLGLGYPFLLKKLGEFEVCAPLFVWQLQLEADAKHSDRWQVLFPESAVIFPNYPLFHLIDRLHQTDFSAQARQITERGSLNGNTLATFCERIGKLLQLSEDDLPLSIQPFPEKSETTAQIERGSLRWSALLGIFSSLPKTTSTQAPVVAAQLPAMLEWRHTLSQLPLDPSQRQALYGIQQNALSVVEGASGSGKTYLISAAIINALSNGKKCLVVSQSLNALRRAQKFLIEKGFGDLSFVLRDIHSDHLMLTDMLRMAAENKSKATHDEDVFKSTLNRTLRSEQRLDEAWHALHTAVFGAHDYSETVGLYLQANRQAGKELLLSQLQPADFQFEKAEYDEIMAAIQNSEPLFRNFPTLQHPLIALNTKIITDYNPEQGLARAYQLMDELLEQATALHHQYIRKSNEYTEALTDHYDAAFDALDLAVKNLRDAIEDGLHRFGADFEKPASVTEKLYGVFSDFYKQISAGKERIGRQYEALRQLHRETKYFDFDFPANFDIRNIKKIADLAQDFDAALRQWRKKIPGIVREDLRRLNSGSVHPQIAFREPVAQLESSMDAFIEAFNAAGLYEEPVRHEMLTIPKRREFLEELIARLENTQFYLRDFRDFHVWQNHWLSLQPNEQQVVRALCKVKPANWGAAFTSWYLFHLLQNRYAPTMLWPLEQVETYFSDLRDLRNQLPFQISAIWHNRKNKALKALKSADGAAYKTWFGKDNRNLAANQKIETLFREHIHALTETLPVLLVTPQVAQDVVNLSNMLFDLVLVDEAHNIPKQEAYPLFDMAKNLVILGDEKQDMTPFAEDDLLEFTKKLGAPVYSLDYQHQESPDEWLLFHQIAFNTPFKRLPATKTVQDATIVSNVEGRYDENIRTNEAEARQIIDWLNLIEPTPAKTYPVVGIACATVEQRNLIAAQLLQIRQRKMPGHEKIHQLFLNGLGIYQFAELQGQHVDILMLSVTHGLIDSRGALTRDLHFWNTQLGLNQLYVALTRATSRLFIAHSIPPGLHAALAADKKYLGCCILSHLLTFAAQIHLGDRPAAAAELEKMKAQLHYPTPAYPETAFTEEVEIALRNYFEPSQIKKNIPLDGVPVPRMIQPDPAKSDGHPLVLLTDGVLTPSTLPSYEWEMKWRHYFQRNQIAFTSVYATQWWKNPREEARKLAEKVLKPAAPNAEIAPATENPGDV
jgi:hypothetical protein